MLPFAPVVLAAVTPLCGPQDPPKPVDLSGEQLPSIGEALGPRSHQGLGDWIERFDLYGLVAARYLHTESGGSRPQGAFVIQQASLWLEAEVADVGMAFVELKLDYYPENDGSGVGTGEVYMKFRDVCKLGSGTVDLKVGRFDLPFGEYYLMEDADKNRLISFPVLFPYRWDEGILAHADFGSWGATAALSEGNYDRNSATGLGPAFTARLHMRPCTDLYLSASGHYVDGADATALCMGGSVLTPVTGSATGTSPSAEVRSLLGCIDASWQASEALHFQASFGAGRIDDEVDAFDRDFVWWMFEPSYALSTTWRTALRWSGAGTFDDQEGYRFEGRPYANGTASYGFDLRSMQRVALAVSHTFAPGLIGKVETGFDHLEGTAPSGLGDDTRGFVAAELVLSF